MKKFINYSLSATDLLLLGGIVIGFFIHTFSTLPFDYSWMQCLEILSDSIQSRYFPTFLTLALLCGISSPPALWNTLRQPLDQAVVLQKKLTSILVACCTLFYMLWHSQNYTPIDMTGCIFSSFIIYRLLATSCSHHPWLKIGTGVALFQLASYAFTIIKSQLFTIATPHDQAIIQAEKYIFNSTTSPYTFFAELGRNSPGLLIFLEKIYFGFFQRILMVSAFLMGCRQEKLQISFTKTLALCYILGSFSYYILPTLGPVYADPDTFNHLQHITPFTSMIQKALYDNTFQSTTGKLKNIQTYMFAAAMPSLHVAHETIMVFFCRKNLPMFIWSIFFWGCSILAILCLGWHYTLDIPAGIFLAWLCIYIQSMENPLRISKQATLDE